MLEQAQCKYASWTKPVKIKNVEEEFAFWKKLTTFSQLFIKE